MDARLLNTIVLGAAGLLAGCANQASIWRNESGAGNVMAMDAQQRVVLSSSRYVPTEVGKTTTVREEAGKAKVTTTTPNIQNVPKVYYCPEPSPDAIASLASALGLGLSKSGIDAKLDSALATSVASVGLRTPTTQVIRDLLTAACIADMNGSFESKEFQDAFARNQQFVLAAHAIAVIGGEAAAGQAAAGGRAGTSGVDPVVAYNNLKAAQADRQAAEDAKKKADDAEQAAAAADKPARHAQAEAADKKLKDALALEEAATKTASAASAFTTASAAGTATPGTVFFPYKDRMSDKAVSNITAITLQVLAQGFTLDKCMGQLKEIATTVSDARYEELRDIVKALCEQQKDHRQEFEQQLLRLL